MKQSLRYISLLILIGGISLALFFLEPGFKTPIGSFVFSRIKNILNASALPAKKITLFISGDQSELTEENNKLKDKIKSLEAKLAVSKNSNSILPADEEKIQASIILWPPAIAYDHVIINKGRENGVYEGNTVLAYDNIFLGKIGEVFDTSSRVYLISKFGNEHNVFFEHSNTVLRAVGYGNSELRVELPREFPVNTGEKVFLSKEVPYLIGFIEEIVSNPQSTLKSAYIRLPFNINNVHTVGIVN